MLGRSKSIYHGTLGSSCRSKSYKKNKKFKNKRLTAKVCNPSTQESKTKGLQDGNILSYIVRPLPKPKPKQNAKSETERIGFYLSVCLFYRVISSECFFIVVMSDANRSYEWGSVIFGPSKSENSINLFSL